VPSATPCRRHSRSPRAPSPTAKLGAVSARWEPSSFSPAVPPACHSQRSRPVPNGQPRTTAPRPRPAPFPAFAGDDPARSGFGSRGSVGPGLHRPCRARPADRSLVAEDRSAAGVRDRTGPDLGPCWVRGAPGPQGHERSPTVTNGEENLQAGGPSAQPARTTPAGGSDCGTEGRFLSFVLLYGYPATRLDLAVGDHSKDKHDDQACTHKGKEYCRPTKEVMQKLDMRAARKV
jgi:hypothetical protein